jgi:hypothetical protein
VEDIDECSRGLHTCDSATQVCVNTRGSHHCNCKPGYKRASDNTCYKEKAVTTENRQVVFMLRMDFPFMDAYLDMTTTNAKELTAKIEAQLYTSFNTMMNFRGLYINQFMRGSVIAEVVVIFAENLDLLQQTQAGLALLNSVETGSLNSLKPLMPLVLVMDGKQVIIEDACFLYDLKDQCQNSACVVEDSLPVCRCPEGFTGPQCNEKAEEETNLTTIAIVFGVLGAVFLIGLTVFLAIVCCGRRQGVKGRYIKDNGSSSSMEEQLHTTYGHVPRYHNWFKGWWWPLGNKAQTPVVVQAPPENMYVPQAEQPPFVSLVYHGMDNPGYATTNDTNYTWQQRATQA